MKNREAAEVAASRQISRADIAAGYAEILGTSDGVAGVAREKGIRRKAASAA